MTTWERSFQTAFLAAVMDGRLGQSSEVVQPDLFHGEIQEVARTILDFQRSHGLWPGKKMLVELCPTKEARQVCAVEEDRRRFAESEGRFRLKSAAIQAFAMELAAKSEEEQEWGSLPTQLQRVLSLAEKAPEPFDYGSGMQDRHRAESPVSGLRKAPTGISRFDRVMGGGLACGELGLAMAPSKRGKSHIVTYFGVQAILSGWPVLNVTLELRDKILARRYDRAFARMGPLEVSENPEEMERRVRAVLPDTSRLRIVSAPRYSLSVGDIERMVDERLDAWGEKFLLIVDYGSILRRDQAQAKHEAIGEVHERLSSLAQSRMVPIWSPFQTNRQALGEASDDIGLQHAGDSYAAMQHADVILTLNQKRGDKAKNRLRLELTGMRDGAETETMVKYDWATSWVEDIDG